MQEEIQKESKEICKVDCNSLYAFSVFFQNSNNACMRPLLENLLLIFPVHNEMKCDTVLSYVENEKDKVINSSSRKTASQSSQVDIDRAFGKKVWKKER